MSLEHEEPLGVLNQDLELTDESRKKSKISYARDFLLSLSELDVCKKLPSNFDQPLLSEINETSEDRYRISGSLASQTYRHNEYSSSPPTRGDASNHSRGIHGKWENHGKWEGRSSSGKSDRDSDSQSWDSDSGRRYGNQSRRPWQATEHDGLLGSGSFPRPSGYVAGTSAPKFRAHETYQLNRSKEPYHPPRPYKAIPHTRKDGNDTYNNETFGSLDSTSEDRAEEERKRRASFELMRKEQQKAFQEKQKLSPEKSRDEFDILLLMEDSDDEQRLINRRNGLDEPEQQPISHSGLNKPSVTSLAPVSRPLVPPGFSTSVEKNMETNSSIQPPETEVVNDIEDNLLDANGINLVKSTTLSNEGKQSSNPTGFFESQEQLGNLSTHIAVNEESETIPDLVSPFDFSSKTIAVDVLFNKAKNSSKAFEAPGNIEPDGCEMFGKKDMSESNPTRYTSILEKLFGSGLALDGSEASSLIKHHDGEEDTTWSPLTAQSSKFAQWFPEEDKTKVDDLSSGKPNDLLSLIAGGMNGVDTNDAEDEHAYFPFQPSELAESRTASNLFSTTSEDNDQLYSSSKPKMPPAILTCEDLEQSILSEITVKDSSSPRPIQGWNWDGASKIGNPEANVDNHASQHLLSLLQKGTGPKDMGPSANLGARSLDELLNSKAVNQGSVQEADAEHINNSRKPLTLETLFGSAFMQELQPAGGPSSEQGDSSESANLDVLMSGNSGSNSNQRPPIQADTIREQFLSYDPQFVRPNALQTRMEFGSNFGGFENSAEMQRPMDNNLFSAAGSLNIRNLTSAGNSAKPELSSNLEASVDMRGTDVQYHDHVQSSRSNRVGPLFQVLDSHPASIHAQMKITSPENLIQHDTPTTNHQFSANRVLPPFHHPGMAGMDPNARTAMLQQMQLPGNFPPPYLLNAFPGGGRVPSHPNNQVAGFVPEFNPIQGFPFGQRQPSFDGPGIQQVPDVGGADHPEALRRLMERELRLNPKQHHPSATAGHPRQMYGHELDMGFGFR